MYTLFIPGRLYKTTSLFVFLAYPSLDITKKVMGTTGFEAAAASVATDEYTALDKAEVYGHQLNCSVRIIGHDMIFMAIQDPYHMPHANLYHILHDDFTGWVIGQKIHPRMNFAFERIVAPK